MNQAELKLARKRSRRGLVERGQVAEALRQAFVYLSPRRQLKNPVMFVVYVGTWVTLYLAAANLVSGRSWVMSWAWRCGSS